METEAPVVNSVPAPEKNRRVLRLYPDKGLRKAAATKVPEGDELKSLLEDMKYWMELTGGVGIAANQLGENCPVFMARMNKNEEPRVFINPEIIMQDNKKLRSREGCLSLPTSDVHIWRSQEIVLSYFDEAGEKQLTSFTHQHAAIVQHEMDHLAGKLCVDHCSPLQAELTYKKFKKFIQRHMTNNIRKTAEEAIKQAKENAPAND